MDTMTSKRISKKTRGLLLAVFSFVLALSLCLGLMLPAAYAATASIEHRNGEKERVTQNKSVVYDNTAQSPILQVGTESTFTGLLLLNSDGSTMPAGNNHLHIQLAYNYNPVNALGVASPTAYTYNYKFPTSVIGAANTKIQYPTAATPFVTVTYEPITGNTVAFNLKVKIDKMPVGENGYFDLRYFGHVGKYTDDTACGYNLCVEEHGLTSADKEHTYFDCNYGLYSSANKHNKKQAIRFKMQSSAAPVLATETTFKEGEYYKYDGSKIGTDYVVSPSAITSSNGLVIKPTAFVNNETYSATYGFRKETTLSALMDNVYTVNGSAGTSSFALTDYFDVSYVPYVNSTDEITQYNSTTGSTIAGIPTLTADNISLKKTGNTEYTYFSGAKALKLTVKSGKDISDLYGRTIYITSAIEKLHSTTDPIPVAGTLIYTPVSFKFRIDSSTESVTTEKIFLSSESLALKPSDILVGAKDGTASRFEILQYDSSLSDNKGLIGLCAGNSLADIKCGGTVTHGQHNANIANADKIYYHYTSKLENNILTIARDQDVDYTGKLHILVKIFDRHTNKTHIVCKELNAVDEGLVKKTDFAISSTLSGVESSYLKKKDDLLNPTIADSIAKKTPISGYKYSKVSGSAYATINLTFNNYVAGMLSHEWLTPEMLNNKTDSPAIMKKYGTKISVADIYTLSSDVKAYFYTESGYDTLFIDTNPFLPSNAYFVWMIDATDKDLYIMPLKATNWYNTSTGDCYLPRTNLSTNDSSLAIYMSKADGTDHRSTGRRLRFNITVSNTSPNDSSLSIPKTTTELYKEYWASQTPRQTIDTTDWKSNEVKLIKDKTGYNKHVSGVINNNAANYQHEFIFDAQTYLRDPDTNGTNTDYDNLFIDVAKSASSIPGWEVTVGAVIVLGSVNGTDWLSYTEILAQTDIKIRFLKFTAETAGSNAMTISIKDRIGVQMKEVVMTLTVVDSKANYKQPSTNFDFISSVGNVSDSDTTTLNRQTATFNPITLRSQPLVVGATSPVVSKNSSMHDYHSDMNNYQKTYSFAISDILTDPDAGNKINFATSNSMIYLQVRTKDASQLVVSTRLIATLTDSSLQLYTAAVYAHDDGKLCHNVNCVAVGANHNKIAEIVFDAAASKIYVTALQGYSTILSLDYPVVSNNLQYVAPVDYLTETSVYSDLYTYSTDIRLLDSKAIQTDDTNHTSGSVNVSTAEVSASVSGTFHFKSGTSYGKLEAGDTNCKSVEYAKDVDANAKFYIMPNAYGNGCNLQYSLPGSSEFVVYPYFSSDSTSSYVFNGKDFVAYTAGSEWPENSMFWIYTSFSNKAESTIFVKPLVAMSGLKIRFKVSNLDPTSALGVGGYNIGSSDNSNTFASDVTYSITAYAGAITPNPNTVALGLASYGIRSDGYARVPLKATDKNFSSGGLTFAEGGNYNFVSTTSANACVVATSNGTVLANTDSAFATYDGTTLTIAEDNPQNAALLIVSITGGEKNGTSELWIKPKERTLETNPLQLSITVMEEGKVLAQSFSFNFSIANYDYALYKTSVAYADDSFNTSHAGLTFGAVSGEAVTDTDNVKGLRVDGTKLIMPVNNNSLDANDKYFVRVKSTGITAFTFTGTGVTAYICEICNASCSSFTSDCPKDSTHNKADRKIFYESLSIRPVSSVTALSIAFEIIDVRLNDSNEVALGGVVKEFTFRLTCHNTEESVKVDIAEKLAIDAPVYNPKSTEVCTGTSMAGFKNYCQPVENGDFVFCDGDYHYKKDCNTVKTQINNGSILENILLSSIFEDPDVKPPVGGGGKFSSDQLNGIKLAFALKGKADADAVFDTQARDLALSSLGSGTLSVTLKHGNDEVLEITINADQEISFKLLNRPGTEASAELVLRINFKTVVYSGTTTFQKGANCDINVKITDTATIVRSKPLVSYITYISDKYLSAAISGKMLAYDYDLKDAVGTKLAISTFVMSANVIGGANTAALDNYVFSSLISGSVNIGGAYSVEVKKFYSENYATVSNRNNRGYDATVTLNNNSSVKVEFEVTKNMPTVNPAFQYTQAKGLTNLTIGGELNNSIVVYSALHMFLPDPTISKAVISNSTTNVSGDTVTNLNAIAMANPSGNAVGDMLYFSNSHKVYIRDSADATVKKLATNDYLNLSFESASLNFSGLTEQAAQGNVKLTITSKKALAQNVAKTKYLQVEVEVVDLFGQMLTRTIDLNTVNSKVAVNTGNSNYNTTSKSFDITLLSVSNAWSGSYPVDGQLPPMADKNLTISNIITDKDLGNYNKYELYIETNNIRHLIQAVTSTDIVASEVKLYGDNATIKFNNGVFEIYSQKKTVTDVNFKIIVKEFLVQDDGITYVSSGDTDLSIAAKIRVPDSKPVTRPGQTSIISVELHNAHTVNMSEYIMDYDGDGIIISNLTFDNGVVKTEGSTRTIENEFIKITYNSSSGVSFRIETKKKFAQDIPVKVSFVDGNSDEPYEFQLRYNNIAPTFKVYGANDKYKYTHDGSNTLYIDYTEQAKSKAGATIKSSLIDFILDKDFGANFTSSTDGSVYGEYIELKVGQNPVRTINMFKDANDFIIQMIAKNSYVGEHNTVSFTIRDSSGAYPIYNNTEIVNIVVRVTTSNTAPTSTASDNVLAEVAVGSIVAVAPEEMATDVNANDELVFNVQTDESGEAIPVIAGGLADFGYVVRHAKNSNDIYDGKKLEIEIAETYEGKDIILTMGLTIKDKTRGQATLHLGDGLTIFNLKILVVLPPSDALKGNGIEILQTNSLKAYKGIELYYDAASASEAQANTQIAFAAPSVKSVTFDENTMLIDTSVLFKDEYSSRIRVNEIKPGTGYTTNVTKKTVIVTSDAADITFNVEFIAGGYVEELALKCKITGAKPFAFEQIGALDAKLVPAGASSVLGIDKIVKDAHKEGLKITSAISGNKLLLEVSVNANGEVVMVPKGAGQVTVTVTVSNLAETRVESHTFTVSLDGYPEVGIFARLLNDPLLLGCIAGGVVLVLIILIIIIVKARKKKAMMKELEIMLLAEMEAEEQLKLAGGDYGMNQMGVNPYLGIGGTPYNMNQSQMNYGQGGFDPNAYGQSQMNYDPNQQGSFDPNGNNNQFGGYDQFDNGNGFIDLDDYNK